MIFVLDIACGARKSLSFTVKTIFSKQHTRQYTSVSYMRVQECVKEWFRIRNAKTQKEADVSFYFPNLILIWKHRSSAGVVRGDESATHTHTHTCWHATIRNVPGVSEKHQGNTFIWVCVAVGWPRRLDISLNSGEWLPWQHRLNWIQGTYVCLTRESVHSARVWACTVGV